MNNFLQSSIKWNLFTIVCPMVVQRDTVQKYIWSGHPHVINIYDHEYNYIISYKHKYEQDIIIISSHHSWFFILWNPRLGRKDFITGLPVVLISRQPPKELELDETWDNAKFGRQSGTEMGKRLGKRSWLVVDLPLWKILVNGKGFAHMLVMENKKWLKPPTRKKHRGTWMQNGMQMFQKLRSGSEVISSNLKLKWSWDSNMGRFGNQLPSLFLQNGRLS